MWVLSTSRAELREFPSPESVPGGYAILSHVWDQEEQTFQITQSLNKICKQTGANPRDCSNPKIRAACRLAESHGYAWLWVDIACIDKTSSADLSEAINSMYRYYSLAKICYAYLRDVPPGLGVSLLSQPGSAFYGSKWHTRGWTLQELIAPTFVLFLANNWTNIATKAELAGLLQTITHVPAALMKLDTRLADYSLAQRMSWAASRETSRPEDRAYSLLAIFGINMPTLYGEGGEEAFYRLQEEIMKRRADTTLFAWNSPVTLGWSPTVDKYLLAPSPEVFRDCGGVLFEPPKATAQVETWSTKGLVNGERSGTITFSVTPYGVLAHVPLIEHWYEDSDRDEVTAYLFWSDASGSPIGLRLEPCPTSVDPFRPHYNVVKGRLGHLIRDSQGRLLDFRSDGRQVIRPVWQEIYITHRPPSESVSVDPERARGVFVPMNLGSSVPFRISGADVDALPTSPLPIQLTACTPISLPWSGDPPAVLQFKSRSSAEFSAMLHLGRCNSATAPGMPTSGHWAAVHITTKDLEAYLRDGEHERAHDCDLDHIDRWPWRTKAWPIKRVPGDETQTTLDAAAEPDAWIDLQFDACPVSPDTTLITHISTRTTHGRFAPWALGPASPPGAPWPLWPPPPPGAPWASRSPSPPSIPSALGPRSHSYIPATSGEQKEEGSAQAAAAGAQSANSVPGAVIPPRLSPTSTPAPSDGPLVSQAVTARPPPVGHGDLASTLEPGVGDQAAAAEGSTPQLEGSGDDRLEREGDGGDASGRGRRNLLEEPVATTPAESRKAGANSESEAIGNTKPSLMITKTAIEGQREGVDGEEERDSLATGRQGEDAVDMDDGPATQGNAPNSAGVEEETGVSGDASAGGLAGSSRQVTPPPQTWGLFRFLDFKFWKE